MDRRQVLKAMALAPALAALGAGSAPAWTLGPFVKADEANPVLGPGSGTFVCPLRGERVGFEEKDVFNPAAVVRDGRVHLIYRAEDAVGQYKGTSRLGLAWSDDGLHFERRAEPVLYPDHDEWTQYEWEGGCEDPRAVEDEAGNYVLTYTAFDGSKARLFVATSPDLVNWTKHGPAFAGFKGGRYVDVWSKSGAIVCRREGERLVATRLADKYWMYWGDADIYLAWSEDLVHWTPVEVDGSLTWIRRGNGLDKPLLQPALRIRPGSFDSVLVESGPPALLTDRGILLLYNGKNGRMLGDHNLPPATYAAGQALFDPEDPSRLIERTNEPFLVPDRDYEITGQVNQVCFIEGLVFFKKRWILYYGTADSKIAAAVYKPGGG